MDKKRMEGTLKRLAAAGLAGGLLWCSAQGSVSAATLKDVFDEHYYADLYKDLKEAYGYDREALWNHFVQHGLAEGRPMNKLFDVVKYRKQYADLDAAFGDNWDAYIDHYVTVGAKEGRENGTGNEFNAFDYAARYGDLQAAYGNDVLALWNHYQTEGSQEGREARSEEVIEAEAEAERKAEEEREAAEKNQNPTDSQDREYVYEYFHDAAGVVTGWHVTEYDSAGNKIKETSQKADGRLVYVTEYNSAGNMTESTYYNEDGSIASLTTCDYDSAGNYIGRITYSNGVKTEVEEVEYNSDGTKSSIKRTVYKADGSVDYICENDYNSGDGPWHTDYYPNGRKSSVSGHVFYKCAEWGSYNSAGESTYVYREYDQDGNVIYESNSL